MPEGRELARLWARTKYSVMERSYSAYRRLSSLSRMPELEDEFEEVLSDSLRLRRDSGSVRNALLHVWGFFKNRATDRERQEFLNRLARFRGSAGERRALKRLLYDLAIKHDTDVLLESTFFDELTGIPQRPRGADSDTPTA